MKLSDFWHPGGTVGRGGYLLVGVAGFAIKHNLDRVIATYGFGRPWGVFNYWVPLSDVARVTQLSPDEAHFLAALLAAALPFIWIGVVFTLKRLRSAGLPLELLVLFFVPVINLALFLILCLVPEKQHAPVGSKPVTVRHSPFVQALPEGKWASAAVSLVLTIPAGLLLTFFGVQILGNYGWGIFVALPFAMGFASALVYSARTPRTLKSCMGVACLSTAMLGGMLLLFAFEGFFCLLMAIPIAVPLAAFGGACGYLVQRRPRYEAATSGVLSALLLFVPGVQSLEHALPPPAMEYGVRSSIEVHAPPEKVWEHVIAFSEIPPPKELVFRAGIAYPIRAQITGSGPGATRYCIFSTGAFVEPIQIWNEPRQLKFSVAAYPKPMQEWTPYAYIEPRHLHGFMVSTAGEFRLTPLPDGGTLLEGTTWYHHGLWPAAYWRLWSDAIIHRIHMRVLAHIRDEAELGG